MREASTHRAYQIEISTPEGLQQTLSLEDLKNPATFDAVKHGIDQNRFFSLIDLYPDDHVLQCRKAEMLISIEDDNEAFALLKDNPILLARGLEAKLYISLQKIDELVDLISKYIWLKDSDIQQFSDLEKEGMIHVFEMTGVLAARQNLAEFSLLFFNRSLQLANELAVKGRLSILEHHSALVSKQLGQSSSIVNYQGNNTKAKQFTAIAALRTSWLDGYPKIDSLIHQEYTQIITAWKGLTSKNPYIIANTLDDSEPRDSELMLFKSLLNISYVGEIGLEGKRGFNYYIDSVRSSFCNLLYSENLISQVYRLFPLGFLIASQRIPEMQGYCREIPILINEKYRDGLCLSNKTIVLPNEFRRAWLEDDAFPSPVSQLSLLDKSTRHRANKKLKTHDIKYFNIVSIVKYVKAVQNLVKLGYHDYAKLEENLLTSFPKVKNYLS